MNQAQLKPCPFCGGTAEVYETKRTMSRYFFHKGSVPDNVEIDKYIKNPNGGGIYQCKERAYIPRCMDASCIGRTAKIYRNIIEAYDAWNRRADNG